ncbi:DUF899 family protein [Aporhodopirellula aestuarii]|uniref:DUF899 family protein n=1 Tax=Aporhodopirellula aestuarii TaxID=2950107 RepID=A0ABT0TX99_9BACT|nr:DUF899 family protein [Aporhodopirellula aestuarii]MCM2369101.1 DUF899 family protein [Aporhodopirellula aestuarii]
MKFICMGFIDESKLAFLAEEDGQRMMEECFAYDDELRRGGHFLGGEALQAAQNAVTLRIKNGSVEVTDGPYIESKEMLGGILLLEARDLNHAISLMTQHPGVKMGPFEIRPADEEVNALIAARDAAMANASHDECDKSLKPSRGKPAVVSRKEWQSAMDRLRVREKAATRAQDALAAERGRMPMVKIEKDYTFEGPDGKARLIDLFEGRQQLAVYHFMFAESVCGWPAAGCVGCSTLVDNLGHPAHINARGLSIALVSLGPFPTLEAYNKRMGWTLPWYSSAGTTFNEDFGVTTPEGESHGLSMFLRDGDDIYQTYFTGRRGCEAFMTSFALLDRAPLGRQETWEDSPEGWPQSDPYVWWRRHDEYEAPTLTSLQK